MKNFKLKIIAMSAIATGLAAVVSGSGAMSPAFAPRDPLAIARAVADRELFGRVISDPAARPSFEVHHDLVWLDATCMSGVAALHDRLDEIGAPVPRYLDYLEAWGSRKPGIPVPVVHGDVVAAGETYMWLHERSRKTSNHLERTDVMIDFIFRGRKFSQYQAGYYNYWMRFWNDDVHMVAPFLAKRGDLAENRGVPNGKDARDISMEFCRAYADVLQDPATGLFWHDIRSIGDYQWGRGNGWVAAGYTKVLKTIKDDSAYQDDADWLRSQLVKMASTLKDNRNTVGTWNADVLDRKTYREPETSGSVFFVFMLAHLINDGTLGEEYVPVAQKAWHFLTLSVADDGALMRVQPVGRGPITDDFEMNSESYGVGGFLLAAAEMSKLPEETLAGADKVECVAFSRDEVKIGGGRALIDMRDIISRDGAFASAGSAQAVLPGRILPETRLTKEGVSFDWPEDYNGPVKIFYQK